LGLFYLEIVMRLVETIAGDLKVTRAKYHALAEGDEKKKVYTQIIQLQEERAKSRDLGLDAQNYREVPEGSGCFVQIEKGTLNGGKI